MVMTPSHIIVAAAMTCIAASLTAWAIDAWMEARRQRAKELARVARICQWGMSRKTPVKPFD